MIYKFYDTSSLLILGDKLFEQEGKSIISSITLSELENIKTSSHKDSGIKYSARRLLRTLDANREKYEIVTFENAFLKPILKKDLEITNDMKILACALHYHKKHNIIFISNDLALKSLASLFFEADAIQSIKEKEPEKQYNGYKEVTLSEQELIAFYESPTVNSFNLLVNEYLIIYDKDKNIVDKVCWTGEKYRRLNYSNFYSRQFGDIKPMKDDIYQTLAADSLVNNQITMLCGKPGSGKTYLAFGYLFSLLEKNKIDRIVVFCNPVVAKNAAKLGFYPGSVTEKLMSSQVGAVLSSKLGSSLEVERLIQQEKLVLVPAGDARGYETPTRSGVYIMESQNLTSDLMRMLLQRVKEDCKVIVDGDYNEQVDMDVYETSNGMKEMSRVFKGQDFYGQVELKNIHRSKIANIADQMR